MLTPEDKDLLVKKGISEQQIAEQLACFEKGFPFLKLDAAASVEKGIMAPAENEMKNYLDDVFQMPDKMVALLIRFLEQNNGSLSKRAKEKEFSTLTDEEVKDIEEHYQVYFN